ncbi:DUF6099 family protein [Streptomyces sp. SPB074]|uniref:DUF6099 family protein n=1 Tax=Streptomyces sp. (strain SPB074) TaxID=465543 RepID=UPI0001D1E362|nr:DUF6099 family protein [Streptomyces sp. SPB074]EFG64502.1 conserved hypothetical protein [Streptomyces sp. SPB074]
MDATRLAVVTAAALGVAHTEAEVVGEAWQAQALARAVGGVLAVTGPEAQRGAARGLHRTGDSGAPPRVLPRASRLTSVADPPRALDALDALLEEAAHALIPLAATALEGGTYTDCMEAIETLGNCRDAVRLLRGRWTSLTDDAAPEGGDDERADGAAVHGEHTTFQDAPGDSPGQQGRRTP